MSEPLHDPDHTVQLEAVTLPTEEDIAQQSSLRDRAARSVASIIEKSFQGELSKHLGPRQSVAEQAQLGRTKRELLQEALETHDSKPDAGRAFAHTMRARIMPRRTAKQQRQKGLIETATVQANQAERRAQDKEHTEAVALSLGLPQERTSRYREKVVNPRVSEVEGYIRTRIKPPLTYKLGERLNLTDIPFEDRLENEVSQNRERIYTPEPQQPISSRVLDEAKARGDRDAYRKELRRLAEGAGFINRRGIFQEKYGRDLDAEDAAEVARLAEIDAILSEQRRRGSKSPRNTEKIDPAYRAFLDPESIDLLDAAIADAIRENAHKKRVELKVSKLSDDIWEPLRDGTVSQMENDYIYRSLGLRSEDLPPEVAAHFERMLNDARIRRQGKTR
jgi:hypothetical protein